jgi:hypothetical protein
VIRAEPEVDRQGWYWRQNRRVNVPGSGVQQEAFPAPAQKNHLLISLDGGEEDMRGYLGFDLPSLDGFLGSTVRSFLLTAASSPATGEHSQEHAEDAEESQTPFIPPTSSNDEVAEMVACPVSTFLADGADGDPVETPEGDRIEPVYDCEQASAVGIRSDDGLTWTLDLTQMAQVWADGVFADTALALKPADDSPQPPSPDSSWTVELHGRQLDGFSAQMSYTPSGAAPPPLEPPPAVAPVGESQPEAAPPPPPPVVESGTQDTGSDDQLSSGVFVPQPRFPWYFALPIPVAAVALWFVWQALRGEAFAISGTGPAHRVSDRLRARRTGQS